MSLASCPDFECKIGYQVTQGIRVFAGYNFLYWSSVARPGDQINRMVDERTIPIANAYTRSFQANLPPLSSFSQSGFSAQDALRARIQVLTDTGNVLGLRPFAS